MRRVLVNCGMNGGWSETSERHDNTVLIACAIMNGQHVGHKVPRPMPGDPVPTKTTKFNPAS
jgi:hypothetical protein